MLVTDSGKKVVKVSYIHYSVQFQESQEQVRALVDSGSKVNSMSLVYIQKLGLKIWKTNIEAQKVDGSNL